MENATTKSERKKVPERECGQEHIQDEIDSHDGQPDVKDVRIDKKEHLKEQRHEENDSQKDDTVDNSQEDERDDSEEDGPNAFKCSKKEILNIFCGSYEAQVLVAGEADLHKHLGVCKKNPGHKQFVPVNDFDINHLPEGNHDNLLVEYIKGVADLTVRVAVKMTSTERPEFWPNTKQPYPFYDNGGSDVIRVGTGMVRYIDIKYNKGTCPCHKCQHSDTPSKVWGEVGMNMARQVVFDDLEARQTTCRLFYDRQDSPLVTLDNWEVIYANIEEDKCVLKCVTCDVDLLNKLDKMCAHWYDLWEKVNNKYERCGDKLTLIVSHPHGCPKQISVGHWIDRYKVSDHKTKYTYTTCTCPGSIGAYVNPLGKGFGLPYDNHVHSGVNSEGKSFSGAGLDWL